MNVDSEGERTEENEEEEEESGLSQVRSNYLNRVFICFEIASCKN